MIHCRAALALLWAVLAGPLALAQQVAAGPALDSASALRASQAAIGRSVGAHVLLDRQGRPVRLADFGGKPLLVSFIYTGCFQVCPTTTRSLGVAVDQLASVFGADKFNVVSIGFNQPFDSPAAMREFAARMRIDAPNWHFLSPPPAAVDALTRDFGFRFVATPAGFDHVLAVSVLDAQGRIVAQVYGERSTRDQLGEPLRRLLAAAPLPPGRPLAALIERVRILCTVYDPATGEYRTDYGLVLEIAGGVTFALAMAWFFLLEWRTQRRARRAALPAARALVETPR
jgi:protein SCO1/2